VPRLIEFRRGPAPSGPLLGFQIEWVGHAFGAPVRAPRATGPSRIASMRSSRASARHCTGRARNRT